MSAKKKVEKVNEKKQKNKSIFFVGVLSLLIVIFIIVLVIGIFFNKDEEQQKNNNNNNINEDVIYNTNEGVIGDKVVGDITFTNIECSFDGNRSLLEYTITNNSDKSIKLGEYEIVVKDKDNNIIAIMAPTIDYELAPLEAYDTGNAIDIDLSSVSAIELRLNEQ